MKWRFRSAAVLLQSICLTGICRGQLPEPELSILLFCNQEHADARLTVPGAEGQAKDLLSALSAFNVHIPLNLGAGDGLVTNSTQNIHELRGYFQKWRSSIQSLNSKLKLRLVVYTGHGFLTRPSNSNDWEFRFAFKDGLEPYGLGMREMIDLIRDPVEPCLLICDACQLAQPGLGRNDRMGPLPMGYGLSPVWIRHTVSRGGLANSTRFLLTFTEVLRNAQDVESLYTVLAKVRQLMQTRTDRQQGLFHGAGDSEEYLEDLTNQIFLKRKIPLGGGGLTQTSVHFKRFAQPLVVGPHDPGVISIAYARSSREASVEPLRQVGIDLGTKDVSRVSNVGKFQKQLEVYSRSPTDELTMVTTRKIEPKSQSERRPSEDMTITRDVLLESDVMWVVNNLRIDNGVRIITNGHNLNIVVRKNLEINGHADILAFENSKAFNGDDGSSASVPDSTGGNGFPGFRGLSAGNIALSVMGELASGELRVDLSAMSGGDGGKGGKGSKGLDVTTGRSGDGGKGGNGGDGGKGGDGGVATIRLPLNSSATLKIIGSIAKGGGGGLGGSGGQGGEAGSGAATGEVGPVGAAGRDGLSGVDGKIAVIYGNTPE